MGVGLKHVISAIWHGTLRAASGVSERGWRTIIGGSGCEDITDKNKLTIGTYFACIRNISEDVAKLPFRLVKNVGKERVIIEDDPLNYVIAVMANPKMSALNFWTVYISWMVGWGNAYAEIVRNGKGVAALYPIHPNRMRLERLKDGSIAYYIRNNDGTETFMPYDRMFHNFGMSPDGYVGYSVAELMQSTLSVANNAQNFAKSFYANSARPGGILTTDQVLKPDVRNALRDSWNEMYSGSDNAGKTALMDGGVTYSSLTMPLKDAEFIETRRFAKEEIAGWFRMPLYKLQELLRAQGWSTLDAQETDYVNSCLMPWIKRIECGIKHQLMKDYPAEVYAHIEVKGLLRGDMKARAEFYGKLFNMGAITPNEIRSLEDMPQSKEPNADKLFVQGAMVPIDKAGQQSAPNPGVQLPQKDKADDSETPAEEDDNG